MMKAELTGEVTRTELDNGLVVVSENMPGTVSATMGVWVNVGSKHESESEAGISHFIEHMLFKGTPRHTAYDIADLMEGVGGYLNGTTDKEQTCYSARVVDRHFDLAIDLIGDMMRNSLFASSELEIEKKVVLDEIKTYEDSPPDVIHDIFLRTMWRGHPLGRSTIGTEEVVKGADRNQLIDYRDRHYLPHDMLMTVAGHVDHAHVVRKARQWFGDLSGRAAPRPVPLPAVQSRFVYRNRKTEQVYVCLGGEGLALPDEDRYKLQFLDNILGGGMSSRLFQDIREKRGLVYNIGSFQYAYMEGGVFGIFVIAGPQSVPEVMRLVRQICLEMRTNGVTRREFERAREYLKGSFALGLESSSFRMMRLVRSEQCYGRFVPPEEVLQKVDAVTLEDVNECARRYLDLDRYCIAALGPFRAPSTRLLKSIAAGPWEEDAPLHESPRKREKKPVRPEVLPPQPVDAIVAGDEHTHPRVEVR